MRQITFALFLSTVSLLVGNEAFNGRWDIEVANRKDRAWWLEVSGAETATPSGKFVGAPGGQMDKVDEIAVRDGELRFTITRKYPWAKEPFQGVWTARIAGSKLEGDFTQNGKPSGKWTGSRAPVITEKDDGSWREGEPVLLFNGKDLSGWTALNPAKPTGWVVKDGLTSNQGGAENIVSDGKFWNFTLHAEFRLQKGSNSGIGLRGRYEVQIMEDFGRPIDGHSSGTIYGRILPTVNASKKPGEWQTYDIRLVGREATVVFNGIKVIDRKEIEGLTAIAMDPNEGAPGPLVLQGDHGPVEFRSLVLTPLVKK
jgi:hypothetical protein